MHSIVMTRNPNFEPQISKRAAMISINRPKLPNTVITSQLLRLQFEFCQKKIVEGLSLCVLDFNSTHKSKIFTTQPFTEKVCKPLKLTTISVLHTGTWRQRFTNLREVSQLRRREAVNFGVRGLTTQPLTTNPPRTGAGGNKTSGTSRKY